MNKLGLLLLGLLLYSCHVKTAEENTETTALHTIPFTLTAHNNISIKAVINKADTVHLMFHTAANSLDLIKEATGGISTINWDTETEVNSWGGNGTSRSSENNTLEISDLKWDSLRIWENGNSGPTTDGKFGPNLFDGKVIAINYDQREITLHKAVPSYSKDYIKMPLEAEKGFLFIEGLSTIEDDNYPNRFLIHSGYAGTILYDDKFVVDTKIGERIKIKSEKELKDSYGNILKTKKGEVPVFTIGKVDFKDMPVGFFEGTIGRQQMSVLGADLLKRFNIIVDNKREYIYLKPNQSTNTPFSDI